MPKTYSQSELIKYVDVLKITIPRMNKLNIPLTPNNYAVWYAYSQGDNLDLNNAIDQRLNNGAVFTKEINDSLYRDYINRESTEELKEVQKTTKVLIQQLVDKIGVMATGSDRYNGALNECKTMLEGDPDVRQLSQVVDQVLKETEVINQVNQDMINNLQSLEAEVTQLKAGVESLTETAYTDQLTSIPNRRAFDREVTELFTNIENNVFSLLLMDIDHFKSFNDIHGHNVGDKVLIYVAKVIHKSLNEGSLVARYGGEEFVVLLPEIDNSKSLEIAEKIREKVAQRNLVSKTKEKIGKITISIGVATATPNDTIETLVNRADEAMYMAKKLGRNRVENEQQ